MSAILLHYWIPRCRAALFVGLALLFAVGESSAQSSGFGFTTRIGLILPTGDPVVWDTISMDFGPGIELAGIVEWRVTSGLGLRAGLLGAIGSRLTAEYPFASCALVSQRSGAPCPFERNTILLHLFGGPSFQWDRFWIGMDGGWRAYGPWALSCESIASLCTAMQDFTGYPSFALHPHLGFSLPSGGEHIYQVEVGSFVSRRGGEQDVSRHTMYDLTASLGLRW